MTERAYVIRVSAILDRSTAAAVGDAVQQWDRVTRAGERSGERTKRSQADAQRHVAGIRERYFRDQQRQEEKAAATTERAQRHVASIRDRHFRDQQRQEERAAKDHERSLEYVAKIKERHFRDDQRREEQRARSTDRARRERVKEIASDAYQTASTVARGAVGVASSVAGGLGFSTDISAAVARNASLEESAINIANQSKKGTAADRDKMVVDLQAKARELAGKYKLDPGSVLAGLSTFQATSGQTDVGIASLGNMGRLSKAYGADVGGMLASSGEIASNLGDGFGSAEEKAARIYDIMKSITSQGQEGAVEVADYAPQLAKVAAQSQAFAGDVGANIVKLSSLVQIARQTGGASSAREAATSVVGFVNTLRTGARRKEFEAAGVNIDSKTERGKFADPLDIIKDSLRATKGDLPAMKKLFANVIGARAVEGFVSSYNAAGGGDKGIAAVDKQLSRFSGKVSEGEIDERLTRSLRSQKSTGQDWQNQYDEIVADTMRDLIPVMKELAPTVKEIIKALAHATTWISQHLGASIGIAIAGSIAKAAIGNVIKDGLAKLLAGGGGAGGVPGLGGGGAGVGLVGKIGGGALAFTGGFLAGKAIAEGTSDEISKGQSKSVGDDFIAENALGAYRRVQEDLRKDPSKVSSEDLARVQNELKQASAIQRGRIEGALNPDSYVYAAVAGDSSLAKASSQRADADKLPQIQADLAALQTAIAELNKTVGAPKGPIDVNIVGGLPPGAGPAPDGRTGIPD